MTIEEKLLVLTFAIMGAFLISAILAFFMLKADDCLHNQARQTEKTDA